MAMPAGHESPAALAKQRNEEAAYVARNARRALGFADLRAVARRRSISGRRAARSLRK